MPLGMIHRITITAATNGENWRKKRHLFQENSDRGAEVHPKPKNEGQRKRVIGRAASIVSTSVNEKTQKMLPVSTNEKAISQKTFFVSTRLDKYNWLLKCHKFAPWIALKSREKHRIIILKCHKI